MPVTAPNVPFSAQERKTIAVIILTHDGGLFAVKRGNAAQATLFREKLRDIRKDYRQNGCGLHRRQDALLIYGKEYYGFSVRSPDNDFLTGFFFRGKQARDAYYDWLLKPSS